MLSSLDKWKTAGVALALVSRDMNSNETDVAKLSGHPVQRLVDPRYIKFFFVPYILHIDMFSAEKWSTDLHWLHQCKPQWQRGMYA